MGVFGPNRKELFQNFNEEIGGSYVEGSWSKGPRLEIRHESWTMYLDIHVVSNGKSSVKYTRLRVCFKNPSYYELKIKKENVFSKIGKALGTMDIQIGDEIFDNTYVIKSNDESTTYKLLNSATIRELISSFKKMNLVISPKKHQYGTKCSEGESVLSYMVPHVIKDVSTIKKLLTLFEEMLNQLYELRIITEESVTTRLYKDVEEADK